MILKGHSGCSLELVNKNTVRKTSKDNSYNTRLLAQMGKQEKFCHPTVRAPRVFDYGMKNGLAYFDMEYVRGVSFSEFCSYTSYRKVEKLFCKLLPTETQTRCCRDEIIKKCSFLEGFPSQLLELVSWEIPVGECHGDLTFENIIVKDNSLYVIDFLDSFVESSLIDQSKLMQDTFCAWSFRDSNYVPWHHLYMLNSLIQDKRNYILLLIHLYRILPYSNETTKKFIKCKILNVTNKIEMF